MKRIKAVVTMITSILLFTLLLGSVTINAEAEEYWPQDIGVESEAAIIMEQSTGTILYEKNIHEKEYPASITKVLTALVAIENSEMDEVVTFSPESIYNIEVGSSSIARDVDEQMTMEECLYGLLLESANECAYAIAEHVGDKYNGGYDKFIDMMNEKAAELGCTDSHFCNPHGLPEDEHYVSAYDMALIAQAALEENEFVKIIGTRHYTIPPTNKHTMETNLNNQHGMISSWKTTQYLYDGCMGGKTGYTDLARHTLVTYVRRNGMTLICVILKAEGSNHYTDTINLMDYCYDNFSLTQVQQNADILDQNNGTKDIGALGANIDLVKLGDDGAIILPNGVDISQASSEVRPKSDPENPDVVGEIIYTYAGRTVGQADLLFSSDETESYPFATDEEEPVEDQPYRIIDVWKIVKVVAILAAAVLIIIIVVKVFPGFQEKFYRFKNSHKRNPNRKLIKIDRSRNRRRRR